MSADTLAGDGAAEETPREEREDLAKRMTSILIATATIIAALVAFLQTDAGGKATQANRNAQRFAIEALGKRAAGQAEVDYGWFGVTHNWYALDTLASSAEQAGDTAAAERYRTVRDRIGKLSPLMASPYFDQGSGYYPNRAGYESDIYLVSATELAERYSVSAQLNNGWNDKANTYIVHLTLLAVALALFGLSTTPEDWTRWMFLGAGVLIVFVTMGWLAVTVATPIHTTADSAIVAYAKGYGLAHKGDVDGAIKAYNDAVVAAPDYANAYYERGNAYFTQAEDRLGTDPKAVQEILRKAADDYESARRAGRDDANVNWNLGWTYYLLGFFPESISASQRALDADPTLFPVRCNLALTLLADGKLDEARREYANAYVTVTEKVADARAHGSAPPSSLWLLLNSCAADVESLSQRLDDRPRAWSQAPAKDLIADTPELRAETQRLIYEIKSTLTALEYTDKAPGERPTANISAFEFGSEVYDEAGNFQSYAKAASFKNGTKRVVVLYTFQGMVKGQKEIWKVYRNGVEDPSLRVDATWDLAASGKAAKPISYEYSSVFSFAAGEYTVELYIDSYLVQRGTFTIEPRG